MAYRRRYHDHLHLARPRGRTHGVSKRRSDPMSGCLSLDMSSDNACAVRQMSLFAIGAAVRKREFEHRIGPVIIIIPASFATHGDSPYRYSYRADIVTNWQFPSLGLFSRRMERDLHLISFIIISYLVVVLCSACLFFSSLVGLVWIWIGNALICKFDATKKKDINGD